MNIFNSAILFLLFNKSFLECSTTRFHHQHSSVHNTRHNHATSTRNANQMHMAHKSQTVSSLNLENNDQLSKSLQESSIASRNYSLTSETGNIAQEKNHIIQDFPCDTIMCLIEKFEIMKTSTGFLLKKLPRQTDVKKCKNLQCWLNQFNMQKTSYGFQLTNKVQPEVESHQNAPKVHEVKKTQENSNHEYPCQTVMCLIQRYKNSDDKTVIEMTTSTTPEPTLFPTTTRTKLSQNDENYLEDVDQMFDDYFY